MVGLGFPAMAAVVSGMIIQSTPVSFGAVGTPILVGVNKGLSGHATAQEKIAEMGFDQFDALLPFVGFKVGIVHALVGALIPLLLVVFMTRFFGKNRSFKEGLAIAPFALFASVSLTVPYVVVAKLLGPEFPSLLGALIGMAIVVPVAKKGWLLPKGEPWDFPPRSDWEREWVGSLEMGADESKREQTHQISPFTAWLPYLLVALLLVLTRLDALPFAAWLKAIEIKWSAIFGTTIDAALQPLYLPGTVFVLVSLMAVGLHRMGGETVLFCLGGFTQDHGQGLGGVGVHGTNGAGLFEQRRRGGWLRQNANRASRRDCQPSGRCVSAVCPFGRWVWGICCGEQHDQQHDVFAVPV